MAAFLLSRFPARVIAGTGISIVKSGLTYTFSNTLPVVAIASLADATVPLGGSEFVAVSQGGVDKKISQKALISALPVVDKGVVTTGTVTFTVSAGSKQKLTVGGALTVAFTGWPASGNYGEIEINLVNGGAFAVTWPLVNWMVGDGTSSTNFASMLVALAAAGTNFVLVWSIDGGATLYGKAI